MCGSAKFAREKCLHKAARMPLSAQLGGALPHLRLSAVSGPKASVP
jgi:hypothetical protein